MPNETHVRITADREITEADLVLHAAHSGDFYPHHLDVEFCRTQAFGQRIAHGTLTFIFAVALQDEAWPDRGTPTGFDRLRFVSPVHIGDRIHVRVTPLANESSAPERELPRAERCEVLNQDGNTVLAFEQYFSPHRGANG